MKKIGFLSLLVLFFIDVAGQIKVEANNDNGSGYDAIIAAGLDIETPDCVHTEFGPHITQAYDDLLERNVFLFHSHILEDNDRCETFDRVRMEIKGGPGTDLESQHVLGSESYYRWKFKIPTDFKGSSSFCHIFQNKIKGGSDSSFPVLTITPRTSKLELIHNGGDSGAALGKIVSVDIDPFLGTWVEAFVYQLHAEEGKLVVVLKDLKTGAELLNYENDSIDLWRIGAEYSRPKWGIYRSKANGLKDEILSFADFCISEESEELCPSDDLVFIDEEAPSVPINLQAEEVMINSLRLVWEASEDNFGVDDYIIYQDSVELRRVKSLDTQIEGLMGGTSYKYAVSAIDAAGNESKLSDEILVLTDAPDALPGQSTDPFPENEAFNVNPDLRLSWSLGENTDSSYVYFGSADNLELIAKQKANDLVLTLAVDSTYFWQIGQKNANGLTLGPIWSFTTASPNTDGGWLVYRGNQRLDLESSFLEARDIPDEPEIDVVLEDAKVPMNNIYQYFEDSEDKFRWRYSFNESDTAFTVITRIKAFQEATNVGYLEVRLGGYREKLRINHSSFKLERSSPVVEEKYDFDFDADFHLVRITMKDRVMSAYIDENPVPFVVGFSETLDGGSNFEFGKSGGTPTGSFVDWMAIFPNESFGPGEGPLLPEDLILSNDAALSEISVNGVALDGFNLDTLDYQLVLESSQLPNLTVSPRSDLANVDVVLTEQENSFLGTIEVLAQDGVSIKTYRVLMEKSGKVSPWEVYRANARLDIETSFYEPQDIPEPPMVDSILIDPNGSSNTFYQFQDNSSDLKFRWRYGLEEQDTAFTVVARIRGINPEVKNITFFEVRGFGFREKIRINHSTIKFERSEPLVELPYEFDFDKAFHIVRIVMKGNKTTMYLDENPEPFAIANSASDDTNYHFDFGKLGGSECGAIVDWISTLRNQEAAPGQGPELPSDLFLSSDASLSEVTLDGILLDEFDPDSLRYEIKLEGSELPEIGFTANSDLAKIEVDTVLIEGIISVQLQVTAQDSYTERFYELNFLNTSSISDINEANKINIFPNPTSGEFIVKLNSEEEVFLRVFDVNGSLLFSKRGRSLIDVDTELKAGLYFVKVDMLDGFTLIQKLLIK